MYKECELPQLFVSVLINPKSHKKGIHLAQRNSMSLEAHSNVFMCEDLFDVRNSCVLILISKNIDRCKLKQQ